MRKEILSCLCADAQEIVRYALDAVQPDTAVIRALEHLPSVKGKLVLIAAGKAAWRMARTACAVLGDRINDGVVITKYGHSAGSLPKLSICEAGHPIPDENSYCSTQRALDAVQNLCAEDCVLFLLSGGGSALFEAPLIPSEELADVTSRLLACGADIVAINTIRKRLSAVKGGRFAQLCAPAFVFTVVLSDILNDPLDMIASGPAYPDASTCEQAVAIAEKYRLPLSEAAWRCLRAETPKALDNVETHVTGSVRELCMAAARKCAQLGYAPLLLTDCLSCEAREAGTFLASIARTHAHDGARRAFIVGGETVVHLRGSGKGGRNQELALAAARGIAGLENALILSVGSDGTDGPTDAAGGYVTGRTARILAERGFDFEAILENNDAYHALTACGAPMCMDTPPQSNGGLIQTGPTGTNVNDVSILLIGEP